jgi:hypothetical protein
MQEPILTVLNAASTYDLVDLATVKDEFGITDTSNDTKLQRWITQTSKRFAKVCGIVFPEENVSEVFRQGGPWFGWPGATRVGSPLALKRRPVTDVSSITEDTSVLTTSDYEVDYGSGLIYRLTSNSRSHWRGSGITVVYTAGYYPIPEDVQGAVLAILAHKWAINGRDPLLRSFSIENVGSESYWVPLSNGTTVDLPPDLQSVADTIAAYREPVIA